MTAIWPAAESLLQQSDPLVEHGRQNIFDRLRQMIFRMVILRQAEIVLPPLSDRPPTHRL